MKSYGKQRAFKEWRSKQKKCICKNKVYRVSCMSRWCCFVWRMQMNTTENNQTMQQTLHEGYSLHCFVVIITSFRRVFHCNSEWVQHGAGQHVKQRPACIFFSFKMTFIVLQFIELLSKLSFQIMIERILSNKFFINTS